MRAKQLAPSRTPFVDRDGDAIGMAWSRAIGPDLTGWRRLVALAAPALREAAFGAAEPVVVHVALPQEDRPDVVRDSAAYETFCAALGEAAAVKVDIDASRTFHLGHAGFAAAMVEASRWLDGHARREIFVGGVDSAFDPDAAGHFDRHDQIAKEGRDGARILGEGAAFVRLTMNAEGETGVMPRLAAVEHARANQRVARGIELGKMVRRAAREIAGGTVAWVLPDLNGEPTRATSFHEARVIARELVFDSPLDELVQHCSDTGAATGALISVIAIELWNIGAVRAPNALVTTESDAGHAGVLAWDLPAVDRTATPPPFSASVGDVMRHRLGRSASSRTPTEQERAHLEAMARTCLDDVGSMGLLLGANPETEGEPEDMAAFAQRLLDAYDAFAALGVGCDGAVCLPDLREVLDRYARGAANAARRYAASFVATQLFDR